MVAGTLASSYFSLSPDASWVPLAKVLVYCIRPDGEIINDVLDVSFTKILRNNVNSYIFVRKNLYRRYST